MQRKKSTNTVSTLGPTLKAMVFKTLLNVTQGSRTGLKRIKNTELSILTLITPSQQVTTNSQPYRKKNLQLTSTIHNSMKFLKTLIFSYLLRAGKQQKHAQFKPAMTMAQERDPTLKIGELLVLLRRFRTKVIAVLSGPL